MSNYSSLIITQGATHYWSLDEPSAPYVDAIGGVNLSHSENMTSELGAVNAGAVFSGTGLIRSLNQDSSVAFDSFQGFSYSYLALFTSYSINRGVISKRQSGTAGRSFSSFVFNQSAGTGLSFDIGNGQMRWSTNYYPPVKEWVHIAYSYDPATLGARAYVNGELIASHTYSSRPSSSQTTAHIMIGALQADVSGSAGSYMGGMVDEMAFFINKTLTAQEVRAQAAAVLPVMRIYTGSNWVYADKRVIS